MTTPHGPRGSLSLHKAYKSVTLVLLLFTLHGVDMASVSSCRNNDGVISRPPSRPRFFHPRQDLPPTSIISRPLTNGWPKNYTTRKISLPCSTQTTLRFSWSRPYHFNIMYQRLLTVRSPISDPTHTNYRAENAHHQPPANTSTTVLPYYQTQDRDKKQPDGPVNRFTNRCRWCDCNF